MSYSDFVVYVTEGGLLVILVVLIAGLISEIRSKNECP